MLKFLRYTIYVGYIFYSGFLIYCIFNVVIYGGTSIKLYDFFEVKPLEARFNLAENTKCHILYSIKLGENIYFNDITLSPKSEKSREKLKQRNITIVFNNTYPRFNYVKGFSPVRQNYFGICIAVFVLIILKIVEVRIKK